MITQKIAAEGMKGRRKDTVLLLLVITLAFMFIVTATTYEASIQVTDRAQRLQVYGRWHAAYLSADAGTAQALASAPEVSEAGFSRIYTTAGSFGTIGTMDEKLLDLGNLRMQSGRLPVESGEAAIEQARAQALGFGADAVGQQLLIESSFSVEIRNDESYSEYYDRRSREIGDGSRLVEERRHINRMETVGSVTIVMREAYRYVGPAGEFTLDEMTRDGYLVERTLFVSRGFTVTGVIETYSDRWDTSIYPLVNTVITDEALDEFAGALEKTTLTDASLINSGNADRVNVFLASESLGSGIYEALLPSVLERWGDELSRGSETAVDLTAYDDLEAGSQSGMWPFRENALAYPRSENAPRSMLIYIVMVVAFVATALAVFQIFLTQVRRRTRKIALLKSIGATNGQVISVFFFEGLILLAIGLPAGVALGMAASWGIVSVMNAFGAASLSFAINPANLALGIGAGCASLFAGMLSPMVLAVRVPLTGSIEKPPRRGRRGTGRPLVARILTAGRSPGKKAFFDLNFNHFRNNRGRSALALSLSLITSAVLAIVMLLAAFSYSKYNAAVRIAAKPGYTVELGYAMNPLQMEHFRSRLEAVRGVSSVTAYQKGEELHIFSEKLSTDPTVSAFRAVLPASLTAEHFEQDTSLSGEYFVQDAMISTLYSFSLGGDMEELLRSSLTAGEINDIEYNAGREVVLLVPMARALGTEPKPVNPADILRDTSFHNRFAWLLERAGLWSFSYDRFETQNYAPRTAALQPGDTLMLSADAQIITGETMSHVFTPYDVKVSAVISYFPDENIWPFSDTCQQYVVVGSPTLLSKLYVGANDSRFGNMSAQGIIQLTSFVSDTKYGRSVFYVYTDSRANYAVTDTEMAALATERGGVLTNYRESSDVLRADAQNNATILALLGITSSGLACLILYNTLASTAEQDRKRIGILQSVGVTQKKLRRLHISTGLWSAIGSVLAVHAVLVAVLLPAFATAAASQSVSLGIYLQKLFAFFPWTLYVVIQLAFVAATVFTHLLPVKRIINTSPVENMRVM